MLVVKLSASPALQLMSFTLRGFMLVTNSPDPPPVAVLLGEIAVLLSLKPHADLQASVSASRPPAKQRIPGKDTLDGDCQDLHVPRMRSPQ